MNGHCIESGCDCFAVYPGTDAQMNDRRQDRQVLYCEKHAPVFDQARKRSNDAFHRILSTLEPAKAGHG